jgi:hypothetical protein
MGVGVVDDGALIDERVLTSDHPQNDPPAAPGRVLMTGTGLRIPKELGFDEWERAGRQLAGIVDSSSWWLGDWLVYGKKHYADRYRIAIRSAGLRYQTLRNYAWVARRFDLSRRRAALTFQHHAEVASRPPHEQDQLLDQAEQENWTTKQLREAARGSVEPVVTASVTSARIELPNNRVGVWRRAADEARVDFDKWVMTMLDWAAAEVLGDEPPPSTP